MSGENFDVTRFLIAVSIMLFTAKLLGEIFSHMKQPAIMGEIIAGLLLGPTFLGTFFPDFFGWLFPGGPVMTAIEGLITLAVVLLLLVSGMEVDLTIALRQSKAAIFTGVLGIVVPFSFGFTAVYVFPDLFVRNEAHSQLLFAVFLGTAMSISALPVIAKSLMDIGIFKTEIGSIIISAAMFNDIIGWLIFSLILGKIGNSAHPFNFGTTLVLTIAFALFAVIVLRKLINKIIPAIQTRFSYPGGMLNFIFIVGLLGAAFTEYIGVHAIFGSFIIGITIGNSAHLKDEIRDNINQFITNLFAPLFFVSIGLRVNFGAYFNLQLVILVLVLAFIGKIIGCGIGARLGGLDKNDAMAIGFGMNSRGAMEIILGLIALQAGLINEELFVALVIMAVVTSVTGAPLMNHYINRKKITFLNILKPELIFHTDYKSKDEIINFLVFSAAEYYKLDPSEIIKDVAAREETNSTGIANYLALPHGRVKFNKPVVAAAINKTGLNFESLDSTPSHIIILLLTPRDKNELQLKLLAEISGNFRDKETAERYISTSSPKEFMNLLSSK